MTTARLEAFSDGVVAIIITIMVLELKVPHGAALGDLRPLLPVLLGYVMSFLYIAIYWNNHHHLLKLVGSVNGAILWGNLHLLFWLSLVPFSTAWMGENNFAPVPVALYSATMLMPALAWKLLQHAIVTHEGRESLLARALGADRKGWLSIGLYAVAVAVALAVPWLAVALVMAVALMWLIPDRRFERMLREG